MPGAGAAFYAGERRVYNLCAEALANVSKHAAASAASIEVAPRADRLAVVVRDNGAGGADASHGGGLAGLADRTGASSARALVDLMRDGRQ